MIIYKAKCHIWIPPIDHKASYDDSPNNFSENNPIERTDKPPLNT